MPGSGIDRRELFRRGGKAALATAVGGPQQVAGAVIGSPQAATPEFRSKIIASGAWINSLIEFSNAMLEINISMDQLAQKNAQLTQGSIEEVAASINAERQNQREMDLRLSLFGLRYILSHFSDQGLSFDDLRRNSGFISQVLVEDHVWDAGTEKEKIAALEDTIQSLQNSFGTVPIAEMEKIVNASGLRAHQAYMHLEAQSLAEAEREKAAMAEKPATAERKPVSYVAAGGYAYPVYG